MPEILTITVCTRKSDDLMKQVCLPRFSNFRNLCRSESVLQNCPDMCSFKQELTVSETQLKPHRYVKRIMKMFRTGEKSHLGAIDVKFSAAICIVV